MTAVTRKILQKARNGGTLSHSELKSLLGLADSEERALLYQTAREVRNEVVGNVVYPRGLIEFSNICGRDCLYCGIRKSNHKVSRFELSDEEIFAASRLAIDFGYGSVVLQSGERRDKTFCDRVEKIVREISTIDGMTGITLSCGEQTIDTYRRWRDAGATRYLLRIESSNRQLFSKIHPPEVDFDERVQALRDLRACDYQVGSGVMIGLLGQNDDDLASDIEFFQTMDLDMIGMGPWIPHRDAPLASDVPETHATALARLNKTLNMIACTRLQMPTVNIAAATALQAIAPENGRQRGLLAGANVLMPNVTMTKYKKDYTLYDNKPDFDENAENIRAELESSLKKIGENICFRQSGDSLHYRQGHPKK